MCDRIRRLPSENFAQQDVLTGATKEKEKEGIVIPYCGFFALLWFYSSRLGITIVVSLSGYWSQYPVLQILVL
jgi:hypothetical protein